MPKHYRTRNNAVTALDTRTQLTVDGEQSAPGPLQVPAGAKSLLGVYLTGMCDFAAAEQGGYLVRLEGPGLPEGPETLPVAATGVFVATGGAAAHSPIYIPLDIPVVPSNEIIVTAEMVGVDVGSSEVGATLVFME